jgi:hypothetical protein
MVRANRSPKLPVSTKAKHKGNNRSSPFQHRNHYVIRSDTFEFFSRSDNSCKTDGHPKEGQHKASRDRKISLSRKWCTHSAIDRTRGATERLNRRRIDILNGPRKNAGESETRSHEFTSESRCHVPRIAINKPIYRGLTHVRRMQPALRLPPPPPLYVHSLGVCMYAL